MRIVHPTKDASTPAAAPRADGPVPPGPGPGYAALQRLPRFTPGNIRTHGWDLDYVDAPALWSCIDVLELKRWNDFTAARPAPRILDLGANVGVSVLRYKRLYPAAEIVAVEPDPAIHRVLRRNLEVNGAGDVRTIEAAAWIAEGRMAFFAEGADGSKLLLDGRGGQGATVRTLDLAQLVDQPIDLVKMDIEGAEYDVVAHLGNRLKLVQSMIIEAHVDFQRVGDFADLLKNLAATGFQVAFSTYGPRRDLMTRPARLPNEFDQYALVSAWR